MVGGNYVGADVAELRGLADRMAKASDELGRIDRMLSEAVTSNTHWQGPDADRFRADWVGEHHPLLGRVLGALRAASQAVQANAQQQESASTPGAGAGGVRPMPGSRTWPTDRDEVPLGPQGSPLPAGPAADAGARLHDLLDRRIPGTPDYYPATWENALGMIPHVGHFVNGALIADAWTDPASGGWDRVASLLDAGADVAKGRGPVGYLAGVAVHTYVDLGEALAEVDFSSAGLAMTFDYIKNDPWGAAVSGAESVVEYLPKLASNLWPF